MFLLSEMSEMFPKFYLWNVELKVVGQESTNNEYRFCWDRSIEFVKPSLNFRSAVGELMTALYRTITGWTRLFVWVTAFRPTSSSTILQAKFRSNLQPLC